MLEDQPTGLKKTVQDSLMISCRNQGSNQGHLDLQSNALPTELFRHINNNTDHIQHEYLKKQ